MYALSEITHINTWITGRVVLKPITGIYHSAKTKC
jgi:hypothetical protein